MQAACNVGLSPGTRCNGDPGRQQADCANAYQAPTRLHDDAYTPLLQPLDYLDSQDATALTKREFCLAAPRTHTAHRRIPEPIVASTRAPGTHCILRAGMLARDHPSNEPEPMKKKKEGEWSDEEEEEEETRRERERERKGGGGERETQPVLLDTILEATLQDAVSRDFAQVHISQCPRICPI